MIDLETITNVFALSAVASIIMTNTASYIATKCISYKKNITPKQIYDIVSAEFNTAPNQNKFDSPLLILV